MIVNGDIGRDGVVDEIGGVRRSQKEIVLVIPAKVENAFPLAAAAPLHPARHDLGRARSVRQAEVLAAAGQIERVAPLEPVFDGSAI